MGFELRLYGQKRTPTPPAINTTNKFLFIEVLDKKVWQKTEVAESFKRLFISLYYALPKQIVNMNEADHLFALGDNELSDVILLHQM